MAQGPRASRTLQNIQERMSEDQLTSIGSRSLYRNTNSLVCAMPPTAQEMFDLSDDDNAEITIDIENEAVILQFSEDE